MKKNCIPNVRFPEFKKDGEWKEVCLGECLIQKPEYGLNMPAVPFSPNKPTYLRITDIADDGTFISSNKMSVDAEITSENSLEEGDIVLARTGASVGKAYKFRKEDGPLVFAGFLIRIRLDAKKLNADYLFHYLFSSEYKKWVEAISMRGAQPGINSAEYSSLKIPCPPSVEEQRKIANLLSSVDDLILDSREKQKMLQEQKKGLLQKLFPKDGKKVPEYRFPEFKNDGEWTNAKLDKVAFFVNEKIDVAQLKRKIFVSTVDLLPNYAGLQIESFFPNEGSFVHFQKDDILFSNIRPYLKKIWIAEYEGCVSNDVLVFRSVKKYYAPFISYLIKNDSFVDYSMISAKGVKMPRGDKKTMMEYPVYIPGYEEQKKIAETLSSVDDLISVYTDKIDQLTQYKKGLMQQLFAK